MLLQIYFLQQCFLFFIVVVILGHNRGNSQVSVYRTIGPTLFQCSYINIQDFSTDVMNLSGVGGGGVTRGIRQLKHPDPVSLGNAYK